MKRLRYTIIALGLLLAACSGGTEIALENSTSEVDSTTTAAASAEQDPEPAEVDDAGSDDVEAVVEPTTETEPQPEPAPLTAEEAAAAAATNIGLLAGGETVFDYDVLNVADGSISSIEQVVDGDRSVLLWFFAPH